MLQTIFHANRSPLDGVFAVSFLLDRQRHPMKRDLRNQRKRQAPNLTSKDVAQHCDFSVYEAFQPKDFSVRATNMQHAQQSHQFTYVFSPKLPKKKIVKGGGIFGVVLHMYTSIYIYIYSQLHITIYGYIYIHMHKYYLLLA